MESFKYEQLIQEGEYPTIPLSAINKNGPVSGIAPGQFRFVNYYSAVSDKVTRQVMVDVDDLVPDNQDPKKHPMAIMRVSQQIGDRAVDGYIVDCRRVLPFSMDRLDADGELLQIGEIKRRYNPVPALGIIVMNKIMKEPEYIGQIEGRDAALQLIHDVDKARKKAKKRAKKKAALRKGETTRPVLPNQKSIQPKVSDEHGS